MATRNPIEREMSYRPVHTARSYFFLWASVWTLAITTAAAVAGMPDSIFGAWLATLFFMLSYLRV